MSAGLPFTCTSSMFLGSRPPAAPTPRPKRCRTARDRCESLARLESPWAIAALPDERFLITEKPGRLRVYSGGTMSEPIGGVPRVEYLEQGGLLDVAVDFDFAHNQLVYLYFTERAERQPPNATLVPDPRLGPFVNKEDNVLKGGAVARGRLEGNALRDAHVIWRQEPKTIGMGHFGGHLVFGPGGKLFITSGDRQRFEPDRRGESCALGLGHFVLNRHAVGAVK